MTWATIISILAALGLGTPITVILTRILNRKRNKIDAAEVVQGMAIGVAQEIRQQLNDVKVENANLKKDVENLETKLDTALAKIDLVTRQALAAQQRADAYEKTLLTHGIPVPVV